MIYCFSDSSTLCKRWLNLTTSTVTNFWSLIHGFEHYLKLCETLCRWMCRPSQLPENKLVSARPGTNFWVWTCSSVHSSPTTISFMTMQIKPQYKFGHWYCLWIELFQGRWRVLWPVFQNLHTGHKTTTNFTNDFHWRASRFYTRRQFDVLYFLKLELIFSGTNHTHELSVSHIRSHKYRAGNRKYRK